MLGETANLLMDQYGGDIRQLRRKAKRRPDEERKLLKKCKGVGNVGADIFFREVQMKWNVLAPFADRHALKSAKKLKLGTQAKALAKLTTQRDFPKLIAALVRVGTENAYKEVLAKAAQS